MNNPPRPDDPVDRTLHDAFQSRHVPHDIHPSLVDVRWRARRRHHRRNAALIGAAAVTGVGTVALLASRHPGDGPGLSAGEGAGEAVTPTTMLCLSTTTFPPPTTTALAGRTIFEGDTPAAVAQGAGITLDALDAANAGNPDYAAFVVGGIVYIPVGGDTGATTTVMYPTIAPVPFDPCSQGLGWTWHCTDPTGTDEFGRQVFLSCEQEPPAQFATTVPPTGAAFPDSTVQVFDNTPTTVFNTIPPFDSTSTTSTTSTVTIVESPTTTSLG